MERDPFSAKKQTL